MDINIVNSLHNFIVRKMRLLTHLVIYRISPVCSNIIAKRNTHKIRGMEFHNTISK